MSKTKHTKINIKEELIKDIREFKAPILAKIILDYGQENELKKLALEKDHLLSSRAMWVLGHCSDIDYDRIKPFQIELIQNLTHKDLHNGVIRNTLRLFQKHSIPNKYESFMLDKCYEYIKNPTEAIAVRAFAITVVYNISKIYSELLNELNVVLTHMSNHEEPPGIQSRIKNTIKKIKKDLKIK